MRTSESVSHEVDLSQSEPRPESTEFHVADGVPVARNTIHHRCEKWSPQCLVTYDLGAGQGHS